jgi:hypothetical protein
MCGRVRKLQGQIEQLLDPDMPADKYAPYLAKDRAWRWETLDDRIPEGTTSPYEEAIRMALHAGGLNATVGAMRDVTAMSEAVSSEATAKDIVTEEESRLQFAPVLQQVVDSEQQLTWADD